MTRPGLTNTVAASIAYPIVAVPRATSALPQTGALTIFVVSGGRVKLINITGQVTVQVGAVANNTQLLHGTTALCANLNLTGDVIGTRYSITGTFANVMVETAPNLPINEQALEVVLPPGNVVLDCDGSDGGVGRVRWTLVYIPLEAGASVVAA